MKSTSFRTLIATTDRPFRAFTWKPPIARIAIWRPLPNPRTKISASLTPRRTAALTTLFEASDAATGDALLEPLKPKQPPVDQAKTLPLPSVRQTKTLRLLKYIANLALLSLVRILFLSLRRCLALYPRRLREPLLVVSWSVFFSVSPIRLAFCFVSCSALVLPCASVGLRTLASNGESSSMASTSPRLYLYEPFDVFGYVPLERSGDTSLGHRGP